MHATSTTHRRALALAAALTCCGAAAAETNGPADVHFLTDMVPAGHWAARLEWRVGQSRERFDEDGDRVPLADAFDGVTLDAASVPLLAAFGPTASLGTTDIDSRIRGTRQRLTVGYGLTPDLTVGFIIPFGSIHNRVRFDMDGGNLALNPAFDPRQPIGLSNPPLVPVGVAGTTEPVGAAGVQEILTNPLFGYGYEPVQSYHTSELLDPTVGMRWRAYRGAVDSLILTPQVRIGVAGADDPDNLFDVHLDDGSTDLILETEYQRQLGSRFDARTIFKYTWQTPDRITARARGEDETLVSASRTERLKRDLGNLGELSFELGYRIPDWRLFAGFELARRTGDRYTSPTGQDVSGLEANTRRKAREAWAGVSWSGVEAYRAHRLPLPLFVSFYYRGTVAGENVVASDNLYLTLTAIF